MCNSIIACVGILYLIMFVLPANPHRYQLMFVKIETNSLLNHGSNIMKYFLHALFPGLKGIAVDNLI